MGNFTKKGRVFPAEMTIKACRLAVGQRLRKPVPMTKKPLLCEAAALATIRPR
jgi:hypothetical protein